MFLFFVLMLLGVLIRVAFIILLERKVLGYIQLRKGPNKVGYIGLIQSFSDAIKLFVKEQYFPFKSNKYIFYFSPCLTLILSLSVWISFSKIDENIRWMFSSLFFFCCTRLRVYRLIGSGWSSNSNYSLLGRIRGVAQTISYEVRLLLIFISFLVWGSQFNFSKIMDLQFLFFNSLIFFPLLIMWVISCLAETNRTPFDFSEGESELVSGFNIEYSRGGFALLFLGEYARIIFIRFLISLLFFRVNYLFLYFISMVWVYFFIWVRSCYPRYRYDKLINLSWKVFLPRVLFIILYFLVIC